MSLDACQAVPCYCCCSHLNLKCNIFFFLFFLPCRMVKTSFRKSGCIERILLCFRVDLLSITDLIVLGDLSFTAVAQLEIQFLGHSSPHRRSGLPASIQTDIWPQSTKSFTDFFFVHTGDANFSHRTISITSFRILQPKHKKCYRG